MQIEFKDVNYIYNPGTAEEVTALKNISVTVGGDQFIAVIGNTARRSLSLTASTSDISRSFPLQTLTYSWLLPRDRDTQ